mmetsp:Transcript_12171/g.38608  ORF Transcript_12171/g.38608 Transcript_12171/m.38608 type:complete len:199 (-) Transcript_12171:101-697(-)|eukprot:CAMPEP_0170748224 /NCGR_PEP_ID=MMETSP0437-20130122/9740_1 /TAXON_ID=0 /ORGANISM="Sexangularia sp." /LENGTH=198 /DNA_ID=CAMNT_0011087051 /DNA_START=96 /DNA_END=689 /DNA_ORIENTATION=-
MSDKSDDEGPAYVAPKKVGLADLVNADAEDESLQKYKAALLGSAASGQTAAPADDDRRVVIEKLSIIFNDRPEGTITFAGLDEEAELARLKNASFTLKEGSLYKIEVCFRVQHDIVSGLKYTNTVSRKGVRVDKQSSMIGSFGPQAEPHTVTFPRHGWDETPSGMMARGDYKAKSSFVDDDGQKHLEYEYSFSIKKDW